MWLVGSRDVLQLTGLSADQLREWTMRRALIKPDILAQKRGSEAKFSWQIVFLLQLAVVLRTRFYVELKVHRNLLASARELLDGASFLSLLGHYYPLSEVTESYLHYRAALPRDSIWHDKQCHDSPAAAGRSCDS